MPRKTTAGPSSVLAEHAARRLSKRLSERERDDAQQIDEIRAELMELRKKIARHKRALATLDAEEDRLRERFADVLKAARARRRP